MRDAELSTELQKKKMALNSEKDAVENEIAIKREADIKKLNEAKFATRLKEVENQLALEQMKKDQEMEQMKTLLKIKNDSYTPNVLKSMVLDTTKDIYKSLNIKDMRVLNMGGGKDGS